MQKSKLTTICMILIIVIYTTLRVTVLASFEKIYMTNPIFWIVYAIILLKILGKSFANTMIKNEITQYTIIASLSYIIINIIIGLFVGFGKNPYLNTIAGITMNFWTIGVPIICREIIRYKLINNVYDRDKKVISVIAVIMFSIIEFEGWKLFGQELKFYYVFIQIFSSFVPILIRNILYTYLAQNKNYSSAIIYEMVYHLFLWICPVLPNSPWIINATIDISIPTILMLYIMYTQNRFIGYKTKQQERDSNPRHSILLIAVIILLIFFTMGIFPIKPISIASRSMENVLYVGDVVIIKKCGVNDINVGDIIEYQMDNFTIVHRVNRKIQKDGEFYFYTKGDNNNTEDPKVVKEEQIIGKAIFKIKYIGWPAVWLHNLINN